MKASRNFKCMLLSESSWSEKNNMLYNCKYMSFWKKQNYEDCKSNSSCQGWARKECLIGQAQRMFREMKLFYIML